jgi:hypothetical protein
MTMQPMTAAPIHIDCQSQLFPPELLDYVERAV